MCAFCHLLCNGCLVSTESIMFWWVGLCCRSILRACMSQVLSCNRDGMEALRKGQSKAVHPPDLGGKMGRCAGFWSGAPSSGGLGSGVRAVQVRGSRSYSKPGRKIWPQSCSVTADRLSMAEGCLLSGIWHQFHNPWHFQHWRVQGHLPCRRGGTSLAAAGSSSISLC